MPAAGMASTAHSLMGSLLLASVLCQGVPVLPSEVLSDEWLSDLVSALVRVRTKYSDLLQPSSFDAPRTLQWHGPAAGRLFAASGWSLGRVIGIEGTALSRKSFDQNGGQSSGTAVRLLRACCVLCSWSIAPNPG